MSALFSAGLDINPMMVLHGEQSITLHREIPATAEATVVGRVSEVWDKEKAAVLGCEGLVEDADGPLFMAKAMIFVRGAGGFGGERGPRPQVGTSRPTGHLTSRSRMTRARSRLRSTACRGTGTRFTSIRRSLSGLCDGDASRFRSFEARFADRVYCGDTIVTKLWRTGDGEAIVQAETQRGNVVLSQAKAVTLP